MSLPDVGDGELFSLVDQRREAIGRYLAWALDNERRAVREGRPYRSMRMENREDIEEATKAAELFPQHWWGVVVFTCFGSKLGATTVAPHFQHPLPAEEAEATLERISFPRGSVGRHRIQSTLKGARQALISVCAYDNFIHEVLYSGEDFDTRYRRLRRARMRQWGRTTCFDLLVRTGALGIGGTRYFPDLAYLAGSTGPQKGFAAVFGVPLTGKTAPWAEAVLQAWAEHWHEVADRIGVAWEGAPLYPRDQENFLCIYQEQLR
ncbi:MAG TPA: hypothetical protein VFA45_18890 [Actinomycetes bacterium]|nr:hypothetical protein [Actinomycetes bacterium]